MACAQVSPGYLLSCYPRLLKCGLPDGHRWGLPAALSTAPKPPVFLGPYPGHGGALPSHTQTSQSNVMSSLRFSPGRALEGSRIWTGMPGSLPTSLCTQSPITVGLAPHCQMIQSRSWEELQVEVDPRNHRPVSTKPNLYIGDTDFPTLQSAEGVSAKSWTWGWMSWTGKEHLV